MASWLIAWLLALLLLALLLLAWLPLASSAAAGQDSLVLLLIRPPSPVTTCTSTKHQFQIFHQCNVVHAYALAVFC